jgi:hypothetical protein
MKKMLWAIAFILPFGAVTYAVQSASWEISNPEGWRKGEMQGAILSADGALTLGMTATKIALPSQPITDEDTGLWCHAALNETVYFGSAKGVIYSLTQPDNKLNEVFKTGELLITSMVAHKGEIYAGTILNGKIFKIDKSGKGILFATLPASGKYIWQLCFDNDNNLYAATGPEGKVYKIGADGKAEILYDTKKKNVLSLVFNGKDCFYAGTADPGIIYRISLKGRPEIVADLGDMEIKSLVYSQEKSELYIGANKGIKVAPQEFLGLIQQSAKKALTPPIPGQTPKSTSPNETKPIPVQSGEEDGEEPYQPPTPIPAPEADPTAPQTENISPPPSPETPRPPVHCVIYKLADNFIKEILPLNDCYITELKLNSDGVLIAGTDNSGRIYYVFPDGKFFIPYDLDASQVLTLVMDKNNQLYAAATGKKAAVYLPRTDLSVKAEFTAEPWDARFPAQWGNFSFNGQGSLMLQVQSGNTAKPDETWSDWSAPITVKANEQTKPPALAARYFRVKLGWDNKDTVITKITQNYLVQNQPPKIMAFNIAPIPPLPPTGAIQKMPVRKISWQVRDPDGDAVSCRLYYRNENQQSWILLNQEQPGGLIFQPEFNWITDALPDGRYLLKLEATDEKVNPNGAELKDEKISNPITVDNSKPAISIAVNNALECSGQASDTLSLIRRIEYSLDGGKWEPVFPADGILDSRTEEFRFKLDVKKPGFHTIVIRAFDEFGNMGLSQMEFERK